MENVFYVFAIMLTIAFVICVLLKFVKSAIMIVVILLTTSIVFTVFWGDGQGYVDFVAEYLPDDKKYAIHDWYSNYKAADEVDPVINTDKIIADVEALKSETIDGLTQVFVYRAGFR